jgi:hypothetical protein
MHMPFKLPTSTQVYSTQTYDPKLTPDFCHLLIRFYIALHRCCLPQNPETPVSPNKLQPKSKIYGFIYISIHLQAFIADQNKCGPKRRTVWNQLRVLGAHDRHLRRPNLLAGSVLGDGLGTFGDGVLGQFTWQDQTDGGLDFARRDGRLLVVVSQAGSLKE